MSEGITEPGEAHAATWLGFILMCLGMFMAILDIQVVATSLPSILSHMEISDFFSGPKGLIWIRQFRAEALFDSKVAQIWLWKVICDSPARAWARARMRAPN